MRVTLIVDRRPLAQRCKTGITNVIISVNHERQLLQNIRIRAILSGHLGMIARRVERESASPADGCPKPQNLFECFPCVRCTADAGFTAVSPMGPGVNPEKIADGALSRDLDSQFEH
jgi:hypothetical protein